MTLEPQAYQRLLQLLNIPTAPFREQAISRHIQDQMDLHRVPCFEDPFGNLILGCEDLESLQGLLSQPSEQPLWCLMGHMDHPGFHGHQWDDTGQLRVTWYGGTPTRHLRGASVWLSDGSTQAQGRIERFSLTDSKRSLATAQIRLESDTPLANCAAERLYGGFRFRRTRWRSGHRLYTQVADDLVGVHAITETLIRYFARRRSGNTPVLGLLTRAEEVGFVGATKHLELGWYNQSQRPLVFVSIETSRALPGAEIGKGPVIRLGDRRGLFDDHPARILKGVAERLLGAGFQSRWMDGGACEASAVRVFGHPVTGLSLPLGNYHNQGIEGGSDCRGPMGPAPEFVHIKDVAALVTLCQGLLKPIRNWSDPWKQERQDLIKACNRYRKLL